MSLVVNVPYRSMSQFVNFNKRTFTLPSGCKDLIDLLRRPGKGTQPTPTRNAFPPLEIHQEHFPSGGLDQIQRFTRRMLQSSAEAFIMEISAETVDCPLMVYHSTTDQRSVVVLTACEVPRQEAVQSFFAARAAELLFESPHEGTLTVVYPLPTGTSQLTTLLTQLLQEVYALGDDAGLEFSYQEIGKAGPSA